MTAISMPSMQNAEDSELDESGRPTGKKKKFSLMGVFNKVADMAGRAAVTNTIKIAAVTALAGIGASSFVTIGTAAAASALGSALYVYGKETALEWRNARREQRDMTWWDAKRSRQIKIALLTGAAGGAFGAWLAGTETFKLGLEFVKEYGAKALEFVIPAAHAAEPLSGISSAALGGAAGKTTVNLLAPDLLGAHNALHFVSGAPGPDAAAFHSPFGTIDANSFSHAGTAAAPQPLSAENFDLRWNAAVPKISSPFGTLDTQAFAPATDINHFDLARFGDLPAAAVTMTPVTPDASDVWAKAAEMAARSHHGHNALATLLAKAHGAGADAVSPQMLKDSAHDVLRLQDIPWQERLVLARTLAEESLARGNHQAVQFVQDLARLDHGAKPHFNTLARHATHAVKHIVTPPHAAVTPVDRIAAGHEAFHAAPAAVVTTPDAVTVSGADLPAATTLPAASLPVAAAPALADVGALGVPGVRVPGIGVEGVRVDGIEGIEGIAGVDGTAPVIGVESQPLPPVAAFAEVAKCTVASADGANSVACVVSNPDMHAGDYVTFVAAENPLIKATTKLLPGSVDIPTQSFLHERIVADGVTKLNALRPAPRPAS